MQARMVQLISRYVGMGLLAIAGWAMAEVDPETQELIVTISNGLAAAILGVLALVSDLVIHWATNGGIFKQAAARGTVAPVNNTKKGVPAPLIALVLTSGLWTGLVGGSLVTTAIVVPGCTNSHVSYDLDNAMDIYNGAADAVLVARQQGEIDDDAWEDIQTWSAEFTAAMNEALALYRAGEEDRAGLYISTIKARLASIVNAAAQVE